MTEILSSKDRVRDQWCARLPEAHERLYGSIVSDLESSYAMLSVALDEAFASRSGGSLPRAREGAAIAAELFDRLSAGLLAALGAVADQTEHSQPVPDVTPLNPDFFRLESAQRAAAWSHVLHYVLVGARSRFLHKLEVLDGTVGALAGEFRQTADEISEGSSTRPEHHWNTLDSLHYDVNTCLRETMVLLKSFLYSLPAGEVDNFARLQAGRRERPAATRPSPPLDSTRRITRAWT